MFCPRAMFPYWREIWLERVAESRVQSVAAE
jgi:preprotein translocase subunit SecB